MRLAEGSWVLLRLCVVGRGVGSRTQAEPGPSLGWWVWVYGNSTHPSPVSAFSLWAVVGGLGPWPFPSDLGSPSSPQGVLERGRLCLLLGVRTVQEAAALEAVPGGRMVASAAEPARG